MPKQNRYPFWGPVCGRGLPRQTIPVFVILGLFFAKLAYDVDAVRCLVNDLGRSLKCAPCFLNQHNKGRPGICGRGSNSFPQSLCRVDTVSKMMQCVCL